MRIAFACTGFGVLLVACVTTPSPTLDSRNQAEIEQTVRQLDERERVAILNRDRATLDLLWSERRTVNTPSNRVVVGKASLLALIDQGAIDYAQFDRSIELVRVDGDVAVVMGLETVKPIRNAQFAGKTVRRRFTNIWKREPLGWRALYRHANVIEVR